MFALTGATFTTRFMVFVATPSAAVIRTRTLLAPTTSPVLPKIFTVAPASRAIATTETEVVLAGLLITSPSATSRPSNVSEFRVTSADCPPTRTTNEYSLLDPSWAVTVTTISLSPEARVSAPVTSTAAFGSRVRTDTSTDSVPESTATMSPGTDSIPAIEKLVTEESVLKATTKVTV